MYQETFAVNGEDVWTNYILKKYHFVHMKNRYLLFQENLRLRDFSVRHLVTSAAEETTEKG